jgi:plastocyanin
MTARRRSVRAFAPIVALSLGSALVDCSSTSDGAGGAPFSVPGDPVPTDHVTLPRSYRFEPAVIAIDVGTTVTWTNRDEFPHTVHLLDGSGVTKDLPIEHSASITFDRSGTIYYECSIHPQQMHGEVIVS